MNVEDMTIAELIARIIELKNRLALLERQRDVRAQRLH